MIILKKKRKLKLKNIAIFLCFFVIIILVIKVVFSDKSKLVGNWTSDNITIYEFYKNNTGKLIVSLNEYEFNYKLKDNYLYIDFKNEKYEDSKYSYSFKKKKLILMNENGTFTFTKK